MYSQPWRLASNYAVETKGEETWNGTRVNLQNPKGFYIQVSFGFIKNILKIQYL